MHIRRLAAITVLLSACSLISSPTVSTGPGEPAVPTTVAPATTTTTLSEEVVVDTDSLETVGCDQADAAFLILCEVVNTIEREYVDPLAETDLVASAIRGVDEFAVSDATTEPLRCALPSDAFLDLCETLDEADAIPLNGVEAAVRGIVQFTLDPNSAYLDPQARALTEEEQTGSVEGIGALVNTEDQATDDPAANPCPVITDTCRMVVISTFEGSPADGAGLEPGDEFVAVDGQPIIGLSLEEITNMVRGPSGTPVDLELLRGHETLEVTIVRAAIDIPIAEWEVIGSTGYLRLNLFTNNSDEVVKQALGELLASGADRLVFDLRNNPGGSLTSSVNIASEFLADGLVLKTQAPNAVTPYEVQAGGLATDPDLPLRILVNRGARPRLRSYQGPCRR